MNEHLLLNSLSTGREIALNKFRMEIFIAFGEMKLEIFEIYFVYA